ncbi:MAG: putative membrane protein [Chlamydiales bacterium]
MLLPPRKYQQGNHCRCAVPVLPSSFEILFRNIQSALNNNNPARAILQSKNLWQDLGTLGGEVSVACDLNLNQEVVGFSSQEDLEEILPIRAFHWEKGAMRDLNVHVNNLPLGIVLQWAIAINESG